MKIINGVHDLVIVFIPLLVHPHLLELAPGKDRQDGVLAAVEHRYQRSQIQSAAHRYEQQIHSGVRPIRFQPPGDFRG